ncbi:MAG: 4-hydroxybenzoyl-CoA reductase subunit beta [Rhodospirillales bacterium]|nr:4-hydroxybenzoyl-CoA reductase subunit beta [Rhodospirillales bacterium]
MEPLAPFAVVAPRALDAAIAAAALPGARPIAGGTDLMVNLRHGIGAPRTLIDLRAIPELNGVVADAGGLSLGAATRIADIAEDATIARAWPALAEAARLVAGPAHRAAGTLGGNLCLDTRCIYYNRGSWWRTANGFCLKHEGDTCHVAPTGKRCHAAFSGDLAAPLLAYGAEAAIAGPEGTRRQPLAALYREDGAAHLSLAPGEIVTRVFLPPDPPPARYAKARARGAIDFPLAGVAVALRLAGGRVAALRVALTGTNSRPFLLEGTEALTGAAVDEDWQERLGRLVNKQVSPMRTTLLAAQYRRRAAAALAARLVADLAESG